MQEAALTAESRLADNAVGRPAITQIERRIALGLLIGIYLFEAALNPTNIDSQWIHWDFIQSSGWLTGLCLAAIWGGLSSRPIAMRLPEAVGFAAFLGIAIEWGSSSANPSKSSPLWVVLLTALLPMLVILLPLALFRKFRRWRLCMMDEPTVAGKRRLQFSLRQVLIWTTGAGILFGLARWIGPERMQNVEPFDAEEVVMYAVLMSMLVLFFLPVFVCCAGSVLGESRRRFAFWTIILAPLSAVLLFATLISVVYFQEGFSGMNLWEEAADCGLVSFWMIVSFVASAFGSLIVLRYCGYRLVRLQKGSAAGETAAKSPFANASESLTEGLSVDLIPPPATAGRSPFRYLVGALAVFGLLLCGAAHEIRQANRQAAFDRATMKEWEELGADYSPMRYGQMQQLTFSQGQTISQAAVERLQQTGDAIGLETLTIHVASLTDDQLKYLTGLWTLKDLDLSGTGITDGGLVILGELKQLKNLNLNSTNITDAGAGHLRGFIHLKSLNLTGAKVTKEGVEKLKKALPNCVITCPMALNGPARVPILREQDCNPASSAGTAATK